MILLSKKVIYITFVSALSTFLVIGSLDSIRGLIAPYIADSLHLGISHIGFILAAGPLGFLIAGPIAGICIDRFGIKSTTIITTILLIISILLIVTTSYFLTILFAFVMVGFSKGSIEIGLNALVTRLFKNRRSHYLGILHACYGIGAILFPFVVGLLFIIESSWQVVYIVLIGLFLIPLLTFILLKDIEISDRKATNNQSTLNLLKDKSFLFLIFVVFFYVASEVGILSWMPYYLEVYKSVDKNIIPYYISAFFLLLTIGRLFGGYLTEKIGYEKSIAIFSLCGTICLIVSQLGSGLSLFAFPLIGLFYSIIFPTVIAIVSNTFTNQVGSAIGLLSTAAGLGGMLSAWFIGFFGEIIGVNYSFFITTMCIIAVIILINMFVIYQKSRFHKRGEITC